MAEILLDNQSAPTTPASGTTYIYVDSTSKKLTTKNDTGTTDTVDDVANASTANQTGFAADTYVAGSSLTVPPGLLRVGSMFYCCFDMVKTAAGTAAATIIIRFGTAGTTADTARITFTWGAGTAAVDSGIFEVWAHVRTAGASGVLVGIARCTHHLAATGLISTGASGMGFLTVTSSAFDMTVANSIIGVSFNGGTSFAGTNTVVQSYMKNV